MKINRIAGLALLVGSLADCPGYPSGFADDLFPAKKGVSRHSGNNHNPTGMAYHHRSGQRIDRVEVRGDLADFGTGHPADDAALLRVLNVTHSELLITCMLQNESDGQFTLVGTVLFDGNSYPFCQPAEVAIQRNRQVIECIVDLVPVSTPKKLDWLCRAKPRLRVGFIATFPMLPVSGSLTLN